MGKTINNYKELLNYCDNINTYVISKIDNYIYLENGEALKFKNKNINV